MFSNGAGSVRIVLTTVVPVAAMVIPRNELYLANGMALGLASGLAVWGLVYALMTRGETKL